MELPGYGGWFPPFPPANFGSSPLTGDDAFNELRDFTVTPVAVLPRKSQVLLDKSSFLAGLERR